MFILFFVFVRISFGGSILCKVDITSDLSGLSVCDITGIRYLIEGVIWQRLPGFANAKQFLLVMGMRCVEGLTPLVRKLTNAGPSIRQRVVVHMNSAPE